MAEASHMAKWYANYQNDISDKFNYDFIYQRRDEHVRSLQECLDDICDALTIIDGVEYHGSHFITDDFEIDRIMSKRTKDINGSRLILGEMRFRIEVEGESEMVYLPVFLPKLVDDFFYVLNNNKYIAVYQMIDKGTYTTKKNLTLKTLLMPIIYKSERIDCEFEGEDVSGLVIQLDLFKKNVNWLYYLCGKFGFRNAMGMLGLGKDDVAVLGRDGPVPDGMLAAKMGGRRMALSKSVLDRPYGRNLAATICDFMRATKPSQEDLDDDGHWLSRLGKLYTPTAVAVDRKAKAILRSLERILDKRTSKNLIHIHPEDKKSIYHVLRWMFVFYEDLRREDNIDLAGKRIRVAEYLLLPLVKKFSQSTYRILNSRRVSLKHLKTIFSNIPPDYCIKRLVTSRFLKYVNIVNGLDMFVAMKLTQSGEQGMGEDSKSEIAVRYRGQHESYVGRLGLNAASSSDPGVSCSIVPFVDMKQKYFFDEEIRHVTEFVS